MNEGQMGHEQGGQGGAGTVGQLRDQASHVAGQVRDAAAEHYGNLRDTAQDYYEQGRQKAQEWQHGLEDYVHQKPMKALLIAAGVGALLGIIWKKI
jgi:ElaB/YqjD/DUF883 family membrane-anchored ribosome-binding protein